MHDVFQAQDRESREKARGLRLNAITIVCTSGWLGGEKHREKEGGRERKKEDKLLVSDLDCPRTRQVKVNCLGGGAWALGVITEIS